VGATAKIDGSLMQWQAANGCPEVQGIAVGVAGKAMVTLPHQMHRERMAGIGSAAGDGARATMLGTASPSGLKADQIQHFAHRDLLP
jgi:hypothetical protein